MKLHLADADIEYIENFYSTDNAHNIFTTIEHCVVWRQDKIQMFGKRVNIPRLQAYYGDSMLSYRYSNLTLQATPWIPCLAELKQRVSEHCQHDFNAVLINLYRNQSDSVGWHSDDEPELGAMPTIASLSFGAVREFQLKHRITKERLSISLAAGSLLIMRGKTQQYWQHCVPKRTTTRQPRINLTFRKIIT